MWVDCKTAFINLDRMDYISFDQDEESVSVSIYFQGRPDPLVLEAGGLSLERARALFARWVFKENNDEQASASPPNAAP